MGVIAEGFFIFARLTGLLLALPVFNAGAVPPWARMGIALPLALLLLPVAPGVAVPETLSALVAGLVLETLLGLLIGFCVTLIHASLETTAEILGIQAGLSMASVLDPQGAGQTSALSSLVLWLGTGVFIGAGLPRVVLSTLAGSFRSLPPGAVASLDGIGALVPLVGIMFTTAVKLAGPLTVFVLIANITLNVLGRMTQIQQLFFAVGTTIQTTLALILLGATFPVLLGSWLGAFPDALSAIQAVLASAGG